MKLLKLSLKKRDYFWSGKQRYRWSYKRW